MRPSIHRDDTSVVDLLVENNDVSRSLDQLKVIVVAGGSHWRSAVRSQDTTLRQRAVFRPFGRSPISLIEGGHSLLSLRRQRRNFPIRWIYNKRSTSGLADLCSPIPPKLVICRIKVLGFHRSIDYTARRRSGFTVEVNITVLARSVFEFGSLTLGKECFVCKVTRSLERSERGVVPRSLQ